MFVVLSIWILIPDSCLFFFFNDTATTAIYTLSLHDALPIFLLYSRVRSLINCLAFSVAFFIATMRALCSLALDSRRIWNIRSEEHTSELQSQSNLVCRLLLEKKNYNYCSV